MRTAAVTRVTYQTACEPTSTKVHQCLVQQVFQPKIAPTPIPMALEAVHAGFPSVAQDYFAGDFSFDEHVIQHPDTTFIITVAGDSMQGAGIWDGDLLVVDRSLDPQPGDVVIAILDDELTIKRLIIEAGHPVLHAENQAYPDFIPAEAEELIIWGVVVGNFHSQIHAGRGSGPTTRVTRPGMSRTQSTQPTRQRSRSATTPNTSTRGLHSTEHSQHNNATTSIRANSEYKASENPQQATDTRPQQRSSCAAQPPTNAYAFPATEWDGGINRE
ncbi:Peptidase S24-like [Bifidobacterium bohemicum]|uniref:SOS mutagenesis and repair protein UmuD n=1 Tax=Bifidobacterium bohemicum DSM 22767 TaxID=1437606 RepID=A0A086ZJZ5_9BIFI|nr:SOS mutagenesis and repair protein UmuD [Bifidobacterium bohemicum DSM 22767]SCB82892.1 Peptidase S24-like [Bifidobacterium bohemicum]